MTPTKERVVFFFAFIFMEAILIALFAFFLYRTVPISGKYCLLYSNILVPLFSIIAYFSSKIKLWIFEKHVFYSLLIISIVLWFLSIVFSVNSDWQWGGSFLISPIMFVLLSDIALRFKKK